MALTTALTVEFPTVISLEEITSRSVISPEVRVREPVIVPEALALTGV